MKQKLATLAVIVFGTLLLPVYWIASIIIGEDAFEFIERKRS